MTRKDSDTWACIICQKETSKSVICLSCQHEEMKKQKQRKGSITAQQIWFIENKLLNKIESQISGQILLELFPDYDYELDNLSTEQGKDLIAKLLEIVE